LLITRFPGIPAIVLNLSDPADTHSQGCEPKTRLFVCSTSLCVTDSITEWNGDLCSPEMLNT
jgi:hypothetical protein